MGKRVGKRGPNGCNSWTVMKDMEGGFHIRVRKRALFVLDYLSGSQDHSTGKFVVCCQPEEGLDPKKSGGFPNPFPRRAEGGRREVGGEHVR